MKHLSSFTWAVAAAGLITLILLWPTIASSSQPYESTSPTPAVSAADLRQDRLDSYLSRLAWTYECVGDCQRAATNGGEYKRVDSNGLYSYGCLQFQQATYLANAKRYGIDPWADGGIYNCDNQWKIARAMFLENPKAAANNWYTSIYTRGLGMPNI